MKRRWLVWFTLAALLPLVADTVFGSQPATQPAAALERHEFVIRDFRTESGVVLPEARVVYATLGTLNASGDNADPAAVALHGELQRLQLADSGSDPNRVLDPARDFLILTELFGNGRSSSPSNTPEPFHGPRFPVMTIRDNVEAVHRLVTDGTAGQASARRRRILDGRRAGVSVGGQLTRLHGRDRRDVRDGEMLRPRLRAARRTDRRADDRSGVAGRRLHDAAGQGTRSVRHGLGGMAVLAGVVAPGAVAHDLACGHDASNRRGRRSGSASARTRTTTSCRRERGSVTTSEPRRDSTATSRRRSGRSRRACSTCRRRPICTFRSPTRATSRRSFLE